MHIGEICVDRFLAVCCLFSFGWSAHIPFLVDHKLFCVAVSPLTSVHTQTCKGTRAWLHVLHVLVFKAGCLSTVLGLPHVTGQESFLLAVFFLSHWKENNQHNLVAKTWIGLWKSGQEPIDNLYMFSSSPFLTIIQQAMNVYLNPKNLQGNFWKSS